MNDMKGRAARHELSTGRSVSSCSEQPKDDLSTHKQVLLRCLQIKLMEKRVFFLYMRDFRNRCRPTRQMSEKGKLLR